MDIKAEIGRHTDEAEQIITSYLPEEKEIGRASCRERV